MARGNRRHSYYPQANASNGTKDDHGSPPTRPVSASPFSGFKKLTEVANLTAVRKIFTPPHLLAEVLGVDQSTTPPGAPTAPTIFVDTDNFPKPAPPQSITRSQVPNTSAVAEMVDQINSSILGYSVPSTRMVHPTFTGYSCFEEGPGIQANQFIESYESISAHPSFQKYSLEELRVADMPQSPNFSLNSWAKLQVSNPQVNNPQVNNPQVSNPQVNNPQVNDGQYMRPSFV
jgi:hypothetical protein